MARTCGPWGATFLIFALLCYLAQEETSLPGPAALRFAVKQQWLAGSTVLGAGADFWCKCYKCSPEIFMQSTNGYRWGSAPDAMLACKLLKINLLIVSGKDILVRQRARSEHCTGWFSIYEISTTRWLPGAQSALPPSMDATNTGSLTRRA
eukprot:1725934-Amphidinium_carterae.1